MLRCGGLLQMPRLRVSVHKMLTNKLLRRILKDTALANKSYNEIRESALLVGYNYKLATNHGLWVEHYVDETYEYFALFGETSQLPLTIITNEIS